MSTNRRFFALLALASYLLILGAGSIELSKIDSKNNPHFDVFDEAAHFDYVDQLRQGSIPSWGTLYGQKTILIADCLGSAFSEPGDCSEKKRDPKLFPPSGYNYQAQQPPLGYTPYLLHQVNEEDPLAQLTSLREFGSYFWTGLTISLIFLISIVGKLPILRVAFGSSLILLSPVFIHSISTVTNDAAVIAAVLIWVFSELLVRNFNESRWVKFYFRVFAGLIIGLTKGYLLILPFASMVISYGIVLGRFKWNRSKVELLNQLKSVSLTTCFTATMVQVIFLWIQSARSITDSHLVMDSLLGFSKSTSPRWETYLESLGNMFFLFHGRYFGVGQDLIVSELISNLVIASIAVLAFRELGSIRLSNPNSQASILNSLALTITFSLLILAVAWPTLLFIQGGFDFPASPRYALIALPLIGLAYAMRPLEANYIMPYRRK